VEETLNALLDAETDRLYNERHRERTEARRDPALAITSGLQTKAGEVTLCIPKLDITEALWGHAGFPGNSGVAFEREQFTRAHSAGRDQAAHPHGWRIPGRAVSAQSRRGQATAYCQYRLVDIELLKTTR
jgi:hypothetical protein